MKNSCTVEVPVGVHFFFFLLQSLEGVNMWNKVCELPKQDMELSFSSN